MNLTAEWHLNHQDIEPNIGLSTKARKLKNEDSVAEPKKLGWASPIPGYKIVSPPPLEIIKSTGNKTLFLSLSP